MENFLVATCCAILLVSASVEPKKLPTYMKRCKISQPDHEACTKDVVRQIRSKFSAAVPELGLPVLDPLVIPRMFADSGSTGNFAFAVTATDMKFYGASNCDLREAKIDTENDRFIFEIFLEYAHSTMAYKNKGRILLIDINGEGEAQFKLYNTTIKGEWRPKRITKNGEEYYAFDKPVSCDMNATGGWGRFSNLFKDNPQLTDNINKVIEENFLEVFKEFRPSLSEAMGQICTGIINSIHARFPINELYPK